MNSSKAISTTPATLYLRTINCDQKGRICTPIKTLEVYITDFKIAINLEGNFSSLERPLLNVYKIDIQFSIELTKKIKEIANLQFETANITNQEEYLKRQEDINLKFAKLKSHLDAFWMPYLNMIPKKNS